MELQFDRVANDLLGRKSRSVEVKATVELHLDSLLSIAEQLQQAYGKSDTIPQVDLLSIVRLLSDFKETAAVLFSKIEENLKQTEETLHSLRAEKDNLEKGIFQFPQNALDLKQAINYILTHKIRLEQEAMLT